MSDEILEKRRLAGFPDPQVDEPQLTVGEFVDQLLREGSSGYLIHGGPGSGTSSMLRHLARELRQNPRSTAVGPIDMSPYRGQMHPDTVLRDLADAMLLELATEVNGLPPNPAQANYRATAEILEAIDQAFAVLPDNGIDRTILLLDDFDDIHLWAAISLANRLRDIYERHKQHFTFVLVAESDLEELRNKEHVYSPLSNICTSYQLLDLTDSQMRRQARRYAADMELQLSDDDLDDLWDWSRGYPAITNALVRALRSGRSRHGNGYSVENAVQRCIENYRRVEPIRTAVREIEELNNLNVRAFNPAEVLERLSRNMRVDKSDRGARLLLAMGILTWAGRGPRRSLTWRNPFIQRFWSTEQSGQRFVANWRNRPLAFREGQLSAQGSVVVSLFFDLAPMLSRPLKSEFEVLRGTDEWRGRLRRLANELPRGPFSVWREQKRLTNIGFDLNLFREQTVTKFFMPIFEANTQAIELNIKRLLNRFGKGLNAEIRQGAEEMIEREWRRWHRVRIQLTRDGAVHVTLIRDLANPLPLMQILDELLGLESELDSGELVELSVQWELALAATEAFVRQAGDRLKTCLALEWRGPEAAPRTGHVYPLRDRYVIYMLRKLCNCRTSGLRPPEERHIIRVEDLDPLRDDDTRQPAWQTAYNYGRELACLLEGVMVRDHSSPLREIGRFPDFKYREVRRLREDDLSSWQNELYLTSLDNALFVYQANSKLQGSASENGNVRTADGVCQVCSDWEERTIDQIYFPKRMVPYEDYWQCLALGLQYIIELRWTAQWIARQTTNDLSELANLMEPTVIERSVAQVDRLRQNLALTTRLLAHLRDASIPMFMTSADYAASKYRKVIDVSGLPETVQHAEKNIEALNNFLNHHDDQMAQLRADEQNRLVGRIGLILAVLATFVVLPSMWVDFGGNDNNTAIWDYLSSRVFDWPFVILFATSVAIVLVVAYIVFEPRLLRGRRHRHKD